MNNSDLIRIAIVLAKLLDIGFTENDIKQYLFYRTNTNTKNEENK